MSQSARTVLTIITLSLAVWIFFAVYKPDPNDQETVVIVGFCTMMVLTTQALWTGLVRHNRHKRRERE
jgi:hypothetical protein